jgi:hypothetical protein
MSGTECDCHTAREPPICVYPDFGVAARWIVHKD